jgi:SH3-like domain-containing protein
VSEARGRVGPSLDHGVRYLYTRRNLPLRLVETSGEWRRVEDPLGARVWMHRRLLSARPSAMVRPQDDETRYAALRRAPEPDGAMAAWLERDVIVLALEREGDFTRIQVRGLQGWVASSDLWGPIDNVERTQ